MPVEQFLIDATTRHQVLMQRFASGESTKAVNQLKILKNELVNRISAGGSQHAMLADINDLIVSAELINKQSLYDFSVSEARFSRQLYNKVSNVNWGLPNTSALIDSIDNAPMVPIGPSLINLNDSLSTFGSQKSKQITQIIRDGIALGDTTSKIASKVAEIADTLIKRQLIALTKTATNHASSVARLEMFKANKDLTKGYQWISTLDSKTTLICGSRDGEIYPIGLGPMPPAHYSCRSTTIPKVRNESKVKNIPGGDRPSIGDSGVERVSSKVTYGGWLRRQSKDFIDKALGVERSKLFRNNKFSIDKFVDPMGIEYTLKELEATIPVQL